jgi:NADP-dependent 3-hydroxy acid dehydrogenase YdfG
MNIYGHNVLLTGASGGLGQAIAKELHQRGARLTLTARRVEELEALAEQTQGIPRL